MPSARHCCVNAGLRRAGMLAWLGLLLIRNADGAGEVLVLAPLPMEARGAVTGCMSQAHIKTWRVVETGVGKVNATFSATEQILRDKPACVIQFGTAGWLAAPAGAGVLTVVSSAAQWDYGWYERGGFTPQPVNGPSDVARAAEGWRGSSYMHQLARLKGFSLTNRSIHFYLGVSNCTWAVTCLVARVVTGDAFVSDLGRRARIARDTGASVMDMETAATAEVCARRGVPFLALRAITDTPAHNPVVDFRQTADQILAHLAHWLGLVLQQLDTNMLTAEASVVQYSPLRAPQPAKGNAGGNDDNYEDARQAFFEGHYAAAAELLGARVTAKTACAYRVYRLLALCYDYMGQPARARCTLLAAQAHAYAVDDDHLARELDAHCYYTMTTQNFSASSIDLCPRATHMR